MAFFLLKNRLSHGSKNWKEKKGEKGWESSSKYDILKVGWKRVALIGNKNKNKPWNYSMTKRVRGNMAEVGQDTD